MSSNQTAAAALVVLGILALIYGGFSFTKETHEANVGPLHVSVEEKQQVNVPIWAGAGAILVGGILFARNAKR